MIWPFVFFLKHQLSFLLKKEKNDDSEKMISFYTLITNSEHSWE